MLALRSPVWDGCTSCLGPGVTAGCKSRTQPVPWSPRATGRGAHWPAGSLSLSPSLSPGHLVPAGARTPFGEPYLRGLGPCRAWVSAGTWWATSRARPRRSGSGPCPTPPSRSHRSPGGVGLVFRLPDGPRVLDSGLWSRRRQNSVGLSPGEGERLPRYLTPAGSPWERVGGRSEQREAGPPTGPHAGVWPGADRLLNPGRLGVTPVGEAGGVTERPAPACGGVLL